MPSPAPTLNLDGYTDLPPGKIAAIVTYLEMRRRPRLKRLARPAGWSLVRLTEDLPRYRALFRAVGEPWLWFSRAVVPEESLAAILGNPKVEAYALHDGNRDIGLVEIDFRTAGSCELSYLGLVPEAVGTGAGRYLMNHAIRRAFGRPIRRFFVHTCSLDHPKALDFYVRSGFVPYRRAIEVADDPRLTGHLSPQAAPQIPILCREKRVPARRGASSRSPAAKKIGARRGTRP
jgi:GNAT superfamily N-acetyltransferase